MKHDFGYVIKDQDSRYVSGKGTFVYTDEGWRYFSYTGKTKGFFCYENEKQAELKRKNLKKMCNQNGFNKKFNVEYIDNIPDGKLVIEQQQRKNDINKDFGYFIKDSFGCFSGSLGLSVKNMDGSGLEWDYVASKNADRWHRNKNLAIAEIKQLEELNVIAGFEGLMWELIYINPKEFYDHNKDNDILFINKDIPRGCIGKHKKAVKEIRKKYSTIYKEIEMEYRKKQVEELLINQNWIVIPNE